MDQKIEETIGRIKSHPKLVGVDDFEIAMETCREKRNRFRNGKFLESGVREDQWISLRVVYQKRPGRGITDGSGQSWLDDLVDTAVQSARLSSGDPWFRFPLWPRSSPVADAPSLPPVEIPEKSVWQENPMPPIDVEENYLGNRIETVITRKADPQFLHHRKLRYLREYSSVGSSKFPKLRLSDHHCSGHPSEVSESFWSLVNHMPELSAKFKQVRSPFLMSGRAVSTVLSCLSGWFCSDQIRRHSSPLRGLSKSVIFSPVINIVDDGGMPGAPGSSPFDIEGVRMEKTKLVEHGQLVGHLYDTYEATRENRKSTGNYLRRENRVWPSIGHSNLVISPSLTTTDEDLYGGITDGIQIDEILSLQRQSDSQTRYHGEALGRRVIQGELTDARCIIFAQWDLLDLFRRALSVGKSVSISGQCGAPSILFDQQPLLIT